MLTALGLTGTLAAALVASPAPALSPAEVLARRVEARHRQVRDLTARFVQTYRSGAIGRELVEKGVLSLKPPTRMRWDYLSPEKKTFVSDGRTSYFYVPEDRQVIRREQRDARDLPSMLLSGQADILATFEAALEPGPPGLQRLRLTPRQPEPEIEQITVDVEGEGRIRAILVVDAQGNRSHFAFEAIKENVGLEDRLFRFKVPHGVEVITG
ncbi:MAG TPA: outer membrane lipoprotein chaperone LolA [Vicinamibacteria bacterium]|nr:outer membrane lipoprotein chaperone LolA [Vicinamibacteria bacterium]